MQKEVDIIEDKILNKYPNILDILLRDQTTNQNIFWATDNYEHLGDSYSFSSPITTDLITGKNGNIIMPRVLKDKILQQSRIKNMAEVFTPSWICNAQNNLIDKAWFQNVNVFNNEVKLSNGSCTWKVIPKHIKFPPGKTWMQYVRDKRLEISCGEAPYITSRYDSTTGTFIPIKKRIGILDRKFRVINENVHKSSEWLTAAKSAYKSTYAYEWQGDSLLLAREAMLYTFIENYTFKFTKEPLLKSIKCIADIISWNVWQMDGLKAVVPNSCLIKNATTINLFRENETSFSSCEGCQKDNIIKHNGIYCLVKDWFSTDKITKKKGRKIKFIDIIKQQH
jgi:hypothetical protein